MAGVGAQRRPARSGWRRGTRSTRTRGDAATGGRRGPGPAPGAHRIGRRAAPGRRVRRLRVRLARPQPRPGPAGRVRDRRRPGPVRRERAADTQLRRAGRRRPGLRCRGGRHLPARRARRPQPRRRLRDAGRPRAVAAGRSRRRLHPTASHGPGAVAGASAHHARAARRACAASRPAGRGEPARVAGHAARQP